MNSKTEIETIIGEFTDGLRKVLGEKLHAAYVYGAAAFPETLPTGDIDFHVILKNPLTAVEKQTLEALHEALARKYPPLGGELDGYYILLEDAKKSTPPRSEMWLNAVDSAWALHREHIRAGRVITLFGGDPREIYPPVEWPEIEAALVSEIRYIEAHLDQYPDYCILNLCRLIYSFQTRQVVISKAKASEWALDAIPEWKGLVEIARKSYEKTASDQERERQLREVRSFFAFAVSQMGPYMQQVPTGTAIR